MVKSLSFFCGFEGLNFLSLSVSCGFEGQFKASWGLSWQKSGTSMYFLLDYLGTLHQQNINLVSKFSAFLLVLGFLENHLYIYVSAAQREVLQNIRFAKKFPELDT